jgi:hypothetical protein
MKSALQPLTYFPRFLKFGGDLIMLELLLQTGTLLLGNVFGKRPTSGNLNHPPTN